MISAESVAEVGTAKHKKRRDHPGKKIAQGQNSGKQEKKLRTPFAASGTACTRVAGDAVEGLSRVRRRGGQGTLPPTPPGEEKIRRSLNE
jgi:hypothetical protein